MRTRGMVAQGEQRLDGFDDETVDGLCALQVRLAHQRLHQLGIAGKGFEGDWVHDELLSAEDDGGFPARRIHERGSRVLQPVAVARLEHDVARLVLFGDPKGALERAQRRDGAGDPLEGLVGAQSDCPRSELDVHDAVPLACVWYAQDACYAATSQTVNSQASHEKSEC